MSNKVIEIKPYAVYKAEEASDLLRIDKRKLYELIESKVIVGMNVGKGYKILGENLLKFMGSPSISSMTPNR